MEVGSLVAGSVVSCSPSISLREAAKSMDATQIGSIAVMDREKLVGIFTERDLLHALADEADPDSEMLANWMTPSPDTVQNDIDVQEAADWMMATGHRHLPVIDEAGRLLGIVSIKDVLWAMTEPATRARADSRDVS